MTSEQTPFAVVAEEVFERNLATMASFAREHGLALRPHAKTHRSLPAARRQLACGAVGLTVATVQEAEHFAEDGVDDLFVAYPLWVDRSRRSTLERIADRARLRIGVDSPEAAANLAGLSVQVMVEVDSGMHRSGVAPDAVGDLSRHCLDLGLDVAGVFTFPGHSYHPDARSTAAQGEASALERAATAMRESGVVAPLRSGGCTPTATLTGVDVDEIRPGVYPFNDAQQWELGSCGPQDIAYTVHSTVTSSRPGTIVLDAGSKALGADRPAWTSGHGRLLDLPDARITALSEHHAVVELNGERQPPLGSTVRVVPNHVCMSIYLQRELLLHGGPTQQRWPVLR